MAINRPIQHKQVIFAPGALDRSQLAASPGVTLPPVAAVREPGSSWGTVRTAGGPGTVTMTPGNRAAPYEYNGPLAVAGPPNIAIRG